MSKQLLYDFVDFSHYQAPKREKSRYRPPARPTLTQPTDRQTQPQPQRAGFAHPGKKREEGVDGVTFCDCGAATNYHIMSIEFWEISIIRCLLTLVFLPVHVYHTMSPLSFSSLSPSHLSIYTSNPLSSSPLICDNHPLSRLCIPILHTRYTS